MEGGALYCSGSPFRGSCIPAHLTRCAASDGRRRKSAGRGAEEEFASNLRLGGGRRDVGSGVKSGDVGE